MNNSTMISHMKYKRNIKEGVNQLLTDSSYHRQILPVVVHYGCPENDPVYSSCVLLHF